MNALEKGCSSTCCWTKVLSCDCWTMRMFQQVEAPFVAHGIAFARFSLHPHGPSGGSALLNAETAVSGLLLLRCTRQSRGWDFQFQKSCVPRCLMLFGTLFLHHSILHSWSSPLKHPRVTDFLETLC